MPCRCVRLAPVLALALPLLLAACGGGGGTSPPPPPVQRLTLSTTQLAIGAPATSPVAPPTQLSGAVSGNPAAVFATITFTTNGLASVSTPTFAGGQATVTVTGKAPNVLGAGTYHDTITVKACPDAACSSQFAGSPAAVAVTYAVGLDLEPASITAQAIEGEAPAPIPVTASSFTGQGTWTASTSYSAGGNWLSAPASGASLPASFNAALGPLAPGGYFARLNVTANSPGFAPVSNFIDVTYTVKPLLQAGAVTAFAVTSQAPAAGQTRGVPVTVADPSRNTAWTASVDAASPWLSLSSGTGTTGGTSTLGLALVASEVGKLRNGQYVAQVSVAPQNGASSISVPVTLNLDRTFVATVAPYVEASGGAAQVILRGGDFDAATIQAVKFGTQSVGAFTVDGATQLRVTHPALAAGSYPVTLTISGAASDSLATLVVQDASDYTAAGTGTVPISFGQLAEFDPERRSCYVASANQVAALRAGSSAWATQASPASFTQIFGMALSADGRELLVGDERQIVHLDPQTLAETHRSDLSAPTSAFLPAGLARVDDGTVTYAAPDGTLWGYQPWAFKDAQIYSGPTQLVSVQSNRAGNRIVGTVGSNVTVYSILDAFSLTPVLGFTSTALATFGADRFGARWVFSPGSSTSTATVTDGSGTVLGQVPLASSVALTDDGLTYLAATSFPTPTYSSYDLSALPGGSATLKGSVGGSYAALDHIFVTPQQNQIVTCGAQQASAVNIP